VSNSEYFGHDLEAMLFAENYLNWIHDIFTPYLGKKIAEVGAGTGNYSKLILQLDIETLSAFEPSKKMYEILQNKLVDNRNIKLINSTFIEMHKDYHDTFDSIIYVNVMEHIKDDLTELRAAQSALRKGGHLLIFVPAIPWLYSKYDKKLGHYRRYYKKQLQEKIRAAELDVIDMRYFDAAGMLPWLIHFVLLRKDMTNSNVHLYDKYYIPIARRFETLINPPLGKNIILVAKKS